MIALKYKTLGGIQFRLWFWWITYIIHCEQQVPAAVWLISHTQGACYSSYTHSTLYTLCIYNAHACTSALLVLAGCTSSNQPVYTRNVTRNHAVSNPGYVSRTIIMGLVPCQWLIEKNFLFAAVFFAVRGLLKTSTERPLTTSTHHSIKQPTTLFTGRVLA